MSRNSTKPDPALREHATEAQARCLDALIEHGSTRKAGEALGVHHSYVARVVGALQRKAAIKPRGTAGFVPREVTTHYDADGTTSGSTVKEGPESWAEPGGIDAGPARDGHSGYAVKGVSTYRIFGRRIGIDLESNPTIAAVPSIGLHIALEYWADRKLNALADRDDCDAISRKINGGTNGLADRRAHLVKVKSWLL